jgi:hypothetical protein
VLLLLAPPLPVQLPPLTRCEWLDKKNTIFGKIVGDTVYNMLRLNELEVRCACLSSTNLIALSGFPCCQCEMIIVVWLYATGRAVQRLSELEVWGGALPSRAALLMTCLLRGSIFNDCTVVNDYRLPAAMCARVLLQLVMLS